MRVCRHWWLFGSVVFLVVTASLGWAAVGGDTLAADWGASGSTADSTYVMVVFGDSQSSGATFPLPSGTQVTCLNTRTGDSVIGLIGETSRGYYEAVFFSTDAYVAAVGDVMQISVPNAVFVPPNGSHTLTAEDIVLGSARIDAMPDGMSDVPARTDGARIVRCYPNPFNPRVKIDWKLPEDGWVNLAIFDVRGHRVRVLSDRSVSAGLHEVLWDGTNEAGLAMPSGTYLFTLQTERDCFSEKLVLAR